MNSEDPFDLDDLVPNSPVPPAPQADKTVSAAPPYMGGLNPPQREAVLATEGPVLVLAGAGTGKTRVLTTRLGHILATGRSAPWGVLAVTFTNKAAREMQERVMKVLGRPVEGMWIGTFHSICVRILRRHAELVGLQSNFTILDTDDQIRLLKQLIKAENIDDKRWPARQLAGLIDRWKNKALAPDQIPQGEGHAFANGLGGDLYQQYQDRLKLANACDFGDLMMHVIKLFQAHPDVLKQYHRQFRYIMVDEYQDTNVAQYLWLRLLAQGNGNICCVGDDDQSIYGWRGAEVGNILRFSKDYDGAKVIRLEQNYRSTGNILTAASALISANEDRLGKTLWTEAGDGEPVTVKGVWDAPEEARDICSEAENLMSKGQSLEEVAVLVRAGFQMREFETRFVEIGMPYRVIGGPRFYERAEIRDALAYLKVIAQPDNEISFERIINTPKRGLGATTIQKIHYLARVHSIPMTRAARQITELATEDKALKIAPRARTTLSRLMNDFDRWRGLSQTLSHTELAKIVLDESGYTEMWQNDKSPDAPGRLENLKELINGMADFENLEGFLDHVSLVMDNEANTSEAKITLMTMHAAKGLEYDTVFLPGWEEGVFPSQRSLDESGLKALEEERRLAYVGLTRAKKTAHIYFAGNRQVFGQWQTSIPSRFIDDLPEDQIRTETLQGLYGNTNAQDRGWNNDWSGDQDWTNRNEPRAGPGYGPGWKRQEDYTSYRSVRDPGRGTNLRSSPLAPSGGTKKRSKVVAVSDFAVGERVFHDKFGYGIVEDVEGNKLLVAFDKAGTKRVIDQFLSKG